VLGTPNPPDEWHITPFVTRWASAGLAILVSGAFADEAHDLHAASMTLFRRLNHGWPDRSSGLTLPIVPDSVPIVLDSELIVFDGFAGPCERELTTLDALCRVLSAEPELRARLDEPENMAILTKGLAERSLVRAPDKSGLRRDSIDIVHAMHSCGFRHRFGRPLPDDQLPSLTEVVERTMAALATNKFRVGRSIDRSEVEKYARCNFTDVEPWPFEGLVPSRA
jgi:hypothetical protein